ncbi:SidA/IucD/PvdA family monooxygenase [Rhodococcoides kyotonense]|uniref:L-lysine N6-monooxygenase MbtG n=1 Tax=Rhodococcoides kyotonense TaxID=398843 RepID=A0A239N4B8_9NOCA|nr:SidA/IucD/PvdA family monooxygenase [Rhodococcus kyotonensis]SNT49303.1 mycobactin lysine-N-oxygenase [Rhodococcus kyotonensis]
MDTPLLVVIGGGPKALAVAAKAKVLGDLGLPAPRVMIVEQHGIGANWTIAGGWTDGAHRLGTSPEKDLGFPYRSAEFKGFNRHVDHAMSRFSWSSHLIAAGTFGEWIDRGRPAPRHREWARYLQWAARQAEVEVVLARAETLSIVDDRWVIGSDGSTESLVADAVMITGPGTAQSDWERLGERIVGPSTFWNQVAGRSVPVVNRAAVIGAGETAGAILHQMSNLDAMSISVIAPRASLFTRGEGYFENRVFTDDVRWSALSLAQRRELINRADRGVLSTRVMEELRMDIRVGHVEGRVSGMQAVGDHVVVGIDTASGYVSQSFDYVVDARGAREMWMLDLLDDSARDRLELAIGGPATSERVQMSIERSMAVGGLGPALFLPALAALRQGPGFPNLSCLGLLSDRVCSALTESRTLTTALTNGARS